MNIELIESASNEIAEYSKTEAALADEVIYTARNAVAAEYGWTVVEAFQRLKNINWKI